MTDLITRARLAALLWWMVVMYIVLFSIASLCTTIQIAMANGASWGTLTQTQKFLIVIGIFGNWCNTMLAFLHKGIGQVQDADKTLPPEIKTLSVTDTHTETNTQQTPVDNSGKPMIVLTPTDQSKEKP